MNCMDVGHMATNPWPGPMLAGTEARTSFRLDELSSCSTRVVNMRSGGGEGKPKVVLGPFLQRLIDVVLMLVEGSRSARAETPSETT